jgi:predicted RNase H-like HicB family nuclease
MEKSKVSMLVNIDICIEKDEIGYHAFCPSLKGVHTHGDTEKEALKNAKIASTAYIISLLKHHEPIPCCQIIREESEEICSKGRLFKKQTIEIPELV